MIYRAHVIERNDNIEEEVAHQISGVRLTCLASVCRYLVEEGKRYPVQRELRLDGYDVTESPDDAGPDFVETGKGFGPLVQGKLDDRYPERGGLVFEDAVFQRDFGYLDGKRVAVKADRIDVEFLL